MSALENPADSRSCLPQPGELWSLWDLMKTIAAYRLTRVATFIAHGQDAYVEDVEPEADEFGDYHLNEKGRGHVTRAFKHMVELCEDMHVPDLAETYRRAIQKLPTNLETYYFAVQQFEEAMKRRWLFIGTNDTWSLYWQRDLFGPEVSDAFPSAVQEIQDVGNCLALQQPTAAVFHMMRALEPPLVSFGRLFGVTRELTNWNRFLDDVEIEFRKRENPTRPPDWADNKDYYTDMTPYLFAVKNAWRNYTAHLRSRYTDEEARDILSNVRGFMKRAALRLREAP